MRKVHQRPNQAIRLGRTQTLCGSYTIYGVPEDLTSVVLEFDHFGRKFDATIHGTLVTCERCLSKMRGKSR